jgi:hypothetical protein
MTRESTHAEGAWLERVGRETARAVRDFVVSLTGKFRGSLRPLEGNAGERAIGSQQLIGRARAARGSSPPGEKTKEEKVQVLSEGQQVRHDQYGMGIIMESDSERTTVDFEEHGTKKFVTSIWSAALIGEAPVKLPRRRRRGRKSAAKAK